MEGKQAEDEFGDEVAGEFTGFEEKELGNSQSVWGWAMESHALSKEPLSKVCGVPGYLCWQQVIMRYWGSGEGGWPDLRRSGVKVLAGDGWYRKRTRMALVFKDHFSKIPPVAVPQAGIVTYILLNWPVHGVKV